MRKSAYPQFTLKFPGVRPVTSLFVLIVMILSSCSIQKRHYNDGYYVEWRRKNTPHKQKANADHEVLIEEIPTISTNTKLTIEKANPPILISTPVSKFSALHKKSSSTKKTEPTDLLSEEKPAPTLPENAPTSGAAASGVDAPAVVSAFMGWVAVISLMLTVILFAVNLATIALGILFIGALFALIAIIIGSSYLNRTKGNLDRGLDRHIARKGLTLGISFFVIILAFFLFGILILSLG